MKLYQGLLRTEMSNM